jgi:hypothetical protein
MSVSPLLYDVIIFAHVIISPCCGKKPALVLPAEARLLLSHFFSLGLYENSFVKEYSKILVKLFDSKFW